MSQVQLFRIVPHRGSVRVVGPRSWVMWVFRRRAVLRDSQYKFIPKSAALTDSRMNSNRGVHLLPRERGFLPKTRSLAAPTILSKVGLPKLAQKNNLEKGRAIGCNGSPCRYWGTDLVDEG